MSQTPSMMDPHWLPQEPPRSGCGKKLVMGMGCGCFVMVLCCCGGGFGLFWWVQKGVSTEPAAVQAATQEIAQLEIPADMQPRMAIHVNVPFTTRALLVAAFYEDPDTDGMLFLGMSEFLDDNTSQAAPQAFVRERRGRREEPLANRRSEEKIITVKGQPAHFTFITGEVVHTKEPRIEVRGQFAGKSGPAFFWFLGNAEKYPPAKVQTLLESIK